VLGLGNIGGAVTRIGKAFGMEVIAWSQNLTADPPPPPYVDTNRLQILRRVLAKEVLRRAFSELGLFAGSAGDSVHGEFGTASAWNLPPDNLPAGYLAGDVADVVGQWIGRNQRLVEEICDALLVQTRLLALPAALDAGLDLLHPPLD
jgi:hypothetical protein